MAWHRKGTKSLSAATMPHIHYIYMYIYIYKSVTNQDHNCDVKVNVCNDTFLCIFSEIEIAITLAYFGRKAHVEREVEIAKEAYRNFGWAFLLGCIGDLLLLIALIFFVLYTTKHRRKRMETPEVNPAIGLSTLSVTPGTPLPAVGSGAPVRSIEKTTSSVHLPY